MKTTDLAMIFVAIMLPIVIVVYVDVSFLLKKEEQTLYYTNIINSAINDATYAMKNVEGEDQEIDYGYSGIADKRVSVNARTAIQTFYESLYDNFEIKGDTTGQEYIKSHIPALAIVDYNGVYIYSMDIYTDEVSGKEYLDYVLKPKRYYTYCYKIESGNVVECENYEEDAITVIFTMDDYIMVIQNNSVIKGFYLEDNNNNQLLYNNNTSMRDRVMQHLKIARSKTISSIISEEMSFAVSNHNQYSDVDYEFVFPTIALSAWEEMVSNIGIIAFIQGINIGNTKLDYVAHGISGLSLTNRYYVSDKTEPVSSLNYYHSNTECTIYEQSETSYDGYYLNKIDAATSGYYPCPECKP